MGESVADWAAQHFQEAFERASTEMAAKRAEFIKSGAISGNRAVFAFTEIYARNSDAALSACLEGLGNRVQSRGRDWSDGISAIEAALEDHLAKGPPAITQAHGYAPHMNDPAGVFVNLHHGRAVAKVRRRLQHFRSGWTAPPAKPWHERNWLLALILAAIVGAIASQFIEAMARRIMERPGVHRAAPPPPSPRPEPAGPA